MPIGNEMISILVEIVLPSVSFDSVSSQEQKLFEWSLVRYYITAVQIVSQKSSHTMP